MNGCHDVTADAAKKLDNSTKIMKPMQTTHHLSRAGEASHPESLDTPAPDRSYAAPRLEHYGALRKLTAGEIDLGGDYPEQDLS